MASTQFLLLLIAAFLALALCETCTAPTTTNGVNPCEGLCPCQGTSTDTAWEGINCINHALDPVVNVVCQSGTVYTPRCVYNTTLCKCSWHLPTQSLCPVTCPALSCTNTCPNGRQRDSSGCEICDCLTTSTTATVSGCAALTCTNTCPNGRQQNSAGCEICDCQPTVRACSPLSCTNVCPNGRQRDSSGCEICDCKPCNIACPLIACLSNQVLTSSPTSCCPVCGPQPTCEFACSAAPASCPTGYVPATDSCTCATCVPKPSCEPCPALTCPVGTAVTAHPDRCCPSCEPVVNCSLVTCNKPTCSSNQKLTVEDGQCCPTCEDIVACAGVTCDSTPCGDGFEREHVDGYCCPVCLPKNRCDSVVCPAFACPIKRTTLRDGACCYACSPCRENEAGEKVCDRNDNLVCRPGFHGVNCDEPDTTTTIIHHDFHVEVLNSSAVEDAEKALWIILDKARDIPREWVEIHQAKKRSGTMAGTVSCPASDTSCTTALSSMQNAFAADSTLRLSSSAAVAFCSLAAILIATIALMM